MKKTIFNLGRLTLKRISEELETELWYTTLWSDGTDDCVCIELDEECILKAFSDEIMLDFKGTKTFFYGDDFERIELF